jgi:integrase
MKPIRRGATFYLYRRVPRRYARIEPRREVWISLRTDSETEARQKAEAVWAESVAGWEARLAGDTTDAQARFDAARELAHRRGYRFMPVEQVARLPLEELLARIEAAVNPRTGQIDHIEAAAILGTAEQPAIPMSQALRTFWQIAEEREIGMSEDQVRRWRNPRKKALQNFIQVCGDIAIGEIAADDVTRFRDWWMGRIRRGETRKESANKDFAYLSSTFRTVNLHRGLGLANPFLGVRFTGEEKNHRLPFSTDFLRETLLRPGALDGLNLEARCIVLGTVNTGYRPSEGAALTRDQIRLDADVPHISIEPVGRKLKSQYSRRLIPLAGVSLEAFRACPGGFPRYADSSASLSALVNKFLRQNQLVETPAHTLYGLRHAFEDRLLEHDVDERIRRDLMGHTLNRERYGKGAGLDKLHTIIQRIAL